MATGYIFGNKFSSDLGQEGGQYFIVGRVKKVVLGPYVANTKLPDPDYNSDADIGKIRYELLYSTLGTSKSEAISEPAYPISSFIKHYPLVNEIVLILVGPTEKLNDRVTRQQLFYFPPYSLWNHPNHGAFPNASEYAEYLNRQYTNKPAYPGKNPSEKVKLPLGATFEEKETVKNLRPFEGDIILQSRFGQTIRFGSTVPVMKNFNTWSQSGENGSPITIITNNQGNKKTSSKFDSVVENINENGSAIWMTSTQEINLEDINAFPLNSFGVNINPIIQNVVKIQQLPTSDETISAQFQDENSIR